MHRREPRWSALAWQRILIPFVLLAAVKVFVVDLWSLPGFIRVGSLLGLGVFLIVAAFLFERLVLRERPLTRGD